MIYFPELGAVVVSASYVVDKHAFPVVDQDKFSSGAQVPARPVSLVPVAAAGPTPAAADSGDGGGGILLPLPPPPSSSPHQSSLPPVHSDTAIAIDIA